MQKTLSLSLLALLLCPAIKADAPEDRVDFLPEMDVFSFPFYSGYLPIEGTTKSLHYLFSQS